VRTARHAVLLCCCAALLAALSMTEEFGGRTVNRRVCGASCCEVAHEETDKHGIAIALTIVHARYRRRLSSGRTVW
jgi:hypothetical protein